jgi:hypothetical protein
MSARTATLRRGSNMRTPRRRRTRPSPRHDGVGTDIVLSSSRARLARFEQTSARVGATLRARFARVVDRREWRGAGRNRFDRWRARIVFRAGRRGPISSLKPCLPQAAQPGVNCP